MKINIKIGFSFKIKVIWKGFLRYIYINRKENKRNEEIYIEIMKVLYKKFVYTRVNCLKLFKVYSVICLDRRYSMFKFCYYSFIEGEKGI